MACYDMGCGFVLLRILVLYVVVGHAALATLFDIVPAMYCNLYCKVIYIPSI